MKLRKETSVGCIIFKDDKVLLIFQNNTNFWGFPKGHMEKGETELETAKREVKEEIGLDVDINPKYRYVLHYVVRNEIDKTTILYLAKPTSNEIVKQDSEIKEVKWLDFNDAIDLLTYEDSKELLKKAISDLK